jgi:hypothetical protein
MGYLVRIVSGILLGMVLGWTIPAIAADIDKEDLPVPYRSAYFLGRGDTGIAVADYENSLFYNPAGLALYDRPPLMKTPWRRFRTFEENINKTRAPKGFYKRFVLASPMVEASDSIRTGFKDIYASDGDPVQTIDTVLGENIHLGADNFSGLIMRNFGVGVFGSTRADTLISKDPDQGGLETAKARARAIAGITAGFAHPVVEDRFMVGLGFRKETHGRIAAKLDPTIPASEVRTTLEAQNMIGIGEGTAVDLGLMYKGDTHRLSTNTLRLWAGFLLQDVGGTQITPNEPTNLDLDIKQTANLGLGLDVLAYRSYIRWLIDLRDAANQYDLPLSQRLRTGLELWVNGHVGAQVGLHDGYASYGAFVDFVLLRIDAGMYAAEMGSRAGARQDRRMYVRVMVGF